jgi:dihydroorotate dehydrogenase
VGVGSAVHYRGLDAFPGILNEMVAFMKDEGCDSLHELRGMAHR